MSVYFSEPSNVFLLIQADRNTPLTGGFLTWEGRAIRSQRPPLEFPFSVTTLARSAHEATPVSPEPPASRPEPVNHSRMLRLGALAKLTPPKASMMTGWLAAAVVVMAVSAGMIYDESRREPQPPTVEVSTNPAPSPRPEPPAAPKDADADDAPVAAEPSITPPRAEPKKAGAAPAKSADRRSTPRAPLRAGAAPFVPPPMPHVLTKKADAAEPPALTSRPTGNSDALTALSGIAPTRTAVTPPFVSVTADPVTQPSGGGIASALSPSTRRNRAARFTPPAVLRPSLPEVPADVRSHLKREVLINVKVYVNPSGKVDFAELLSNGTGANRDLASMAVFSSRRWEFSPASLDGQPSEGQVVLRFRFGTETR
jgi:hypothetical protein